MAVAAPEFPEYAIRYSKNASTLRKNLPPEVQAQMIEIADELAADPEKYANRVIPLAEDLFIYRHPDPAFEITYKLDSDNKVLSILHLVAPKLRVSKTLFISYSHKDKKWLDELRKWLEPLERADLIAVWDDEQLKAGEDWHAKIQESLAAAKAAVLLVSQDFLVSDFITNNELPQLLEAAQQKGLQILWIAVSESTVEDTGIIRYQAVHKDPPLDSLPQAEQNKRFKEIYKRIREAVNP